MAKKLPKISRNNSRPRCRISGDLLDENNPAFLDSSGFVLGKRSLDNLIEEDINNFYISGKKIKGTEAKRIYFI